MSKSTLTNNRAHVQQAIENRLPDALEAMGSVAVGLVKNNMETGYGRPIRKTGALNADVSHEVNGNAVEVGNTLNYSLFVHDGTYKMAGRAYISDALLTDSAKNKIIDAAKDKLFDK